MNTRSTASNCRQTTLVAMRAIAYIVHLCHHTVVRTVATQNTFVEATTAQAVLTAAISVTKTTTIPYVHTLGDTAELPGSRNTPTICWTQFQGQAAPHQERWFRSLMALQETIHPWSLSKVFRMKSPMEILDLEAKANAIIV